MEHRSSGRVDTDLQILIYKERKPVAVGRIQNGSTLGFFIETDFSEISLLQPLDLEVLLHRGSLDLTRHRYTTRVIRKSEAGLGVELELKNIELAKALEDLLLCPECPRKSAADKDEK